MDGQREGREPLWRLFLDFLAFGCFTFGGGWSIVAQMQKKYVEGRGILTSQELLDITSVGRSLPGLMIGNVAFLFGYHRRGIPGGLVCVLGMVLPPIAILTVVTYCYVMVRDNVYVSRAMAGVRSAVAPIVLSALLRLRKGAFPHPACYGILLGALVLNGAFQVNCVIVILLGAAAGFALSAWTERRDKKC